MVRLKIWSLVTHAAVAIAMLSISNLLSIKKGSIHTQDTPPIHWESKVVPTTREQPTDLFQVYDKVNTYVIFIGHSRSGHSIVGALLDAHPEILISHERGSEWALWTSNRTKPSFQRNWTKYKFFHHIQQDSEKEALFGRRAIVSRLAEGKNTYLYHVDGQWQGQFRDKLKVMGDKSGHMTSSYFRNPKNLVKLDYLKNTLGVSLKIIHVIRNPYDNIATQTVRYRNPRGRDSANPQNKMNKSDIVDLHILSYFQRTEANERIRQKYNVLDIPGHELKQQPKESMQKLCAYLDIPCEEDYIEACAMKIKGDPSITRNFIVWTKKQKRLVKREIEKYSFLSRYNFDSHP